MHRKNNIVIIGGGFAGVKCAQKLAKYKKKGSLGKNVHITLISDREHFEYHGALYRVAAGNTALEVCFPLREILDPKNIDIIQDTVTQIDKEKKSIRTKDGSAYHYDSLVVALGAQTIYFGIPGLREHAYGMKSIERAIKLKNHIKKTIEECAHGTGEEKICGSNFVVVGGGATGVEVAGEVMQYAKSLTKKHGGDPDLVHVDLVEAQERILGLMPEKFAAKMQVRLEDLGVNVMTRTAITEAEAEGVLMKGQRMESKITAKTVIWTAGVRANKLVEDTGFTLGRGGKAIVCAHLRAQGHHDIYMAGDVAQTKYSGMAQTALYDARYIADAIVREASNKPLKEYKPRKTLYAVPAGPGWAGACISKLAVYGALGWAVRRLLDLSVFLQMAPPDKAWRAFTAHYDQSDVCDGCRDSGK